MYKRIGPCCAWQILRGLETIELRIRAQALHGYKKPERRIYLGHQSHAQYALLTSQMSGGGAVLASDIKGGKEEAFTFLNAMNIGLIASNLGDSKSIFVHPATTMQQELSDARKRDLCITPRLIRFYVGLQDADDLIQDILHALG